MTTVTQPQLESYLWGAATLLRGLIDAGDYKQFIFPLLFFKRLCDVYDEESAQLRAEFGGDVDESFFPEAHRFQIPPGAHWRDVRETSRDVGGAIQNAMRIIETANPQRLYGIFGDAAWTNKERLPDRTLRDLVEHFSTLTLSVAAVSEDMLGQAYEYLIKKFADDSGHTAAEFYTNRTVVHLMTLLVDPQPGEAIYDPTCGSGGMLLSAVAELKRGGQEYRNLQLYGQERNLMTSAIARMNLFLHGVEDFHVERGDTLSDPKFLAGDRLRQFDVVLANPPYSIKQWDRDAWAADPYGRNLYGVPPQGRADYAFFQHIIASLNPDSGRCAILFPHGVLFRDEERHMRARLVEADVLEAVIGLGPNLFYNSPMEACIVVCRAYKPPERRDKVLFINAVDEVTRERAQSFLEREHIEKIVGAYRDFADTEGFSSVAVLDEIRANLANLNVPLYAPVVNDGAGDRAENRSLAEVVADWEASSRALQDSLTGLFEVLGNDELRPPTSVTVPPG
jgi:type I restriction enzyme M protein